jgi:hypothetical protein
VRGVFVIPNPLYIVVDLVYNKISMELSNRTLKQEYDQWVAWRNRQSGYRAQQGWSHNRPLYGIISFALEQGWIQKNVLWTLLVFATELFALIPLQLLSGNTPGLLVKVNLLAILATLALLELQFWCSSKLVFLASLPILIGFTCLTSVYFLPNLISG